MNWLPCLTISVNNSNLFLFFERGEEEFTMLRFGKVGGKEMSNQIVYEKFQAFKVLLKGRR